MDIAEQAKANILKKRENLKKGTELFKNPEVVMKRIIAPGSKRANWIINKGFQQ